jgi:hypothetical protein
VAKPGGRCGPAGGNGVAGGERSQNTPSMPHMMSVPALNASSSAWGDSKVGLPAPGQKTRSSTVKTSVSRSW